MVVAIKGGYLIRWEDWGLVSYEGCDGYIARFIHNAVPFRSRIDAERKFLKRDDEQF